MLRPILLLLSLVCLSSLSAQESLLQSGPMLGYCEMKEVMLWVQTTGAADVQFAYWPKDNPDDKHYTNTERTTKAQAFTSHQIADEVEPGVDYIYQLIINGKVIKRPYPTEFSTQPIWAYRTDPPEFTVATGSCVYVNEPRYDRPGNGYGGGYEIFTSINAKQPDIMLWLGDNTYLREADWYSRTGIMHRYTHTRSLPEMQPLLANTHHYAIWDDHEFGPNDSDRSYVHKETTLEAFKLFWANPSYGVYGEEGVTGFFHYADIDFFLLDDRYFRTPNRRKTEERTILGEHQLEWLIDALVHSRSPFKMVAVGGQVLNTAQKYETFSNISPSDRAYLLSRIEEEGIKGVVFLTGDRHHSELSKYVNANGDAIYDLTVSPLTSGAANPDEENALRVEETLIKQQRNFATLTFRGPRLERELLIQMWDTNGELIWDYTIQ